MADHLEQDRQARTPAPVVRRLALSEGARSLLRHLREQKLAQLRAEAGRLVEQLGRVTQEREDLERANAATPEETDIRTIAERLKSATQAFTVLDEQAKQLDNAVVTQRLKLHECDGKLRQLLEKHIDQEIAEDDARRLMQLAGRTRETMQVFRCNGIGTRTFSKLSAPGPWTKSACPFCPAASSRPTPVDFQRYIFSSLWFVG